MPVGKKRASATLSDLVRSKVKRSKVVSDGKTRLSGYYKPSGKRSGELKFRDTYLSALSASDTAGVVNTLCAVPQGTGPDERIGRRLVLKSIMVKGNVVFNPSTDAYSSCLFDMWIVQDKQCNGSAAALSDLIAGGRALGDGYNNLANSSRFHVLKKVKLQMSSDAGVAGALNEKTYRIDFHKKLNMPLEYSSTTGALAEIKSNNIFVVYQTMTKEPTTVVVLNANVRLRFEDN